MSFIFRAYLKFFLKSTNQHGVHSPFVYDLVTKCFYKRRKRKEYVSLRQIYNSKNKVSYSTAKLLYKTITYFAIKKALILQDSSQSISTILSLNNSITIATTPNGVFDMIYADIDALEKSSTLENLFSYMHNDTVLIFNSIYNNITNITLWEEIKQHPKVTVTIDVFRLGFVFIRKEQAKENFSIRT
ncbi:hypothetical protein ACSTS3_11715 [Aquimarina muelleri]|uniref:hypothetical protein n=1 Tax=Aquimarina muelleri TaxID=279356 RepID=UPI003F6827C1